MIAGSATRVKGIAQANGSVISTSEVNVIAEATASTAADSQQVLKVT
jgi:hypothetical protein